MNLQKISTIRRKVQRVFSRMRKSTSNELKNKICSTSNDSLIEDCFRVLHASANDPRARLEIYRSLPTANVFLLTTSRHKHDPLLVYPQAFIFSTVKQPLLESHSDMEVLESLVQKKPCRSESPDACVVGVPIFTSVENLERFTKLNSLSVKGPDETIWFDNSNRTTSVQEISDMQESLSSKNIFSAAIPVFPFVSPSHKHFTGCFAEFERTFQHLKIFPEDFSLIVNPSSASQWSMTLNEGAKIASYNTIQPSLYHEVARVVSSELYSFFHSFCPEVETCSVTVAPRRTKIGDEYNAHPFALIYAIESSDYAKTLRRLNIGRERGHWYGHPSVSFRNIQDLNSMWMKNLEEFYSSPSQRANKTSRRAHGAYSAFEFRKWWDPE